MWFNGCKNDWNSLFLFNILFVNNAKRNYALLPARMKYLLILIIRIDTYMYMYMYVYICI